MNNEIIYSQKCYDFLLNLHWSSSQATFSFKCSSSSGCVAVCEYTNGLKFYINKEGDSGLGGSLCRLIILYIDSDNKKHTFNIVDFEFQKLFEEIVNNLIYRENERGKQGLAHIMNEIDDIKMQKDLNDILGISNVSKPNIPQNK
jgi:hypothetical protein